MDRTFLPDLLDGQVALVTGGGTGIGRGITQALIDHGCEVAIASRSRYKQAAEELGIHGYELDIRDPDRCQAVVDQVEDEVGPIDLLVNNAAGNFLTPAQNLSANGWRAVLSIVLDGTFHMSQAAGKHMLERGQGSMVNIVATYAWGAAPWVAHSGAAKAGVLNLTRSLAAEWGPEGVRVNAIAPGPIVTEKASEHLGYDDPEVQEQMSRHIPMRTLGQVEDIGQSVVFLASPAARWITGECMVVDGGQWLSGNLFELMQD
ncbi:MAG: SDR family oxidoreductase [Candidatus Thermoplasmatota archaeon]|nr:SDR family oxidoreductase [Candidatus Thermoplasmatota archaeon]